MKSNSETWIEVVKLFQTIVPEQQAGRECMTALITAYKKAPEEFKERSRPQLFNLVSQTLDLFPEKAVIHHDNMVEYDMDAIAECLGLSPEDAQFLLDEACKGVQIHCVECSSDAMKGKPQICP